MTVENLQKSDSGHALGRIWDAYEIDIKARNIVEGIAPGEDGSLLTIITSQKNGGGFTPDPLWPRAQHPSLGNVRRFLGDFLRNEPEILALVRGGKVGLNPLLDCTEKAPD
jgi:hypothetical protein